eukprot:353579-Chlamydomonas_euryale.AAC.3
MGFTLSQTLVPTPAAAPTTAQTGIARVVTTNSDGLHTVPDPGSHTCSSADHCPDWYRLNGGPANGVWPHTYFTQSGPQTCSSASRFPGS